VRRIPDAFFEFFLVFNPGKRMSKEEGDKPDAIRPVHFPSFRGCEGACWVSDFDVFSIRFLFSCVNHAICFVNARIHWFFLGMTEAVDECCAYLIHSRCG
jgi:hypothetical protein